MTSTADPRLIQLLVNQTGLDPTLLERPAWDDFVRRRCAELGLESLPRYYQRVAGDPAELERIVQEIAVPETWLFRYPASFARLITFAAEQQRAGQPQLRMLSVACATGEEPLGMAMAAAAAGWPLGQLVLDAVDRHEHSLAIAREGVYGPRSLRGEVPPWAAGWLQCDDDQIRVDQRILQTVNFRCADILEAALADDRQPYHVIFCRNLFIYLGTAARERLAGRLSELLAPGGMLFVGHAEHIVELHVYFQRVVAPHAFAYQHRRPQLADRSSPVAAPPVAVPPPPRSDPKPLDRRPPRSRSAPSAAASRLVSSAPTGPTAAPDATIDDARGLADRGQLTGALAVVEQKIAGGCRDAETYAMLGRIHLGLQHFSGAREAFGRVVYLQPDHEEALLQLASLHEREGDVDGAARFRRRAARAHGRQLEESAPDDAPRPAHLK
ncbi:MAG: hypothetical protein GTO03_15080 [Planctomycetales bacterium]|nr:hypothetical protein [Planctomycetales bacterium]